MAGFRNMARDTFEIVAHPELLNGRLDTEVRCPSCAIGLLSIHLDVEMVTREGVRRRHVRVAACSSCEFITRI